MSDAAGPLILPELHMVPASVKRPEHNFIDQVPPRGCIGVGPGHIPDFGPAVFVSILHPDGTCLVAAIGAAQYGALGEIFTDAGERICAGEFNRPAVKQ